MIIGGMGTPDYMINYYMTDNTLNPQGFYSINYLEYPLYRGYVCVPEGFPDSRVHLLMWQDK